MQAIPITAKEIKNYFSFFPNLLMHNLPKWSDTL